MLVRRRLRVATVPVVVTSLLAGMLAVQGGRLGTPATAAPQAQVAARPDVFSAQLTARLQGSRVQVTELNTPASTTFANPDGTFTTDYASDAVRVPDDADPSGWTPVGTDVSAPATDGSVSVADNPLSPRFAKYADAASAVKVSADGTSLGLSLVGAAHAPVQASGSDVTYLDVLPGGTVI